MWHCSWPSLLAFVACLLACLVCVTAANGTIGKLLLRLPRTSALAPLCHDGLTNGVPLPNHSRASFTTTPACSERHHNHHQATFPASSLFSAVEKDSSRGRNNPQHQPQPQRFLNKQLCAKRKTDTAANDRLRVRKARCSRSSFPIGRRPEGKNRRNSAAQGNRQQPTTALPE